MRLVLDRQVVSDYFFAPAEKTASYIRHRLLHAQVQSHVECVLVYDSVVVAVKNDASDSLLKLVYSDSPFSKGFSWTSSWMSSSLFSSFFRKLLKSFLQSPRIDWISFWSSWRHLMVTFFSRSLTRPFYKRRLPVLSSSWEPLFSRLCPSA